MKRYQIKLLYVLLTMIVINTNCYSWADKSSDSPGEASAEAVKNNVIENGGFEQEGDKNLPSGWQIIPSSAGKGKSFMDSDTVHTGRYSLRIKPNRKNTREGYGVLTIIDPSLIQGKEITISGYAKIENIKKNTAAILFNTDRKTWIVIPKVNEDEFVYFSKSMKIAESIPEALLFIFVAGQTGGIWIDDLALEVRSGSTAVTITPDTGEFAARINSLGWLDSAFISPDGRDLYFGYMTYAQKDFEDILLGRKSEKDIKKRGPIRPGSHGSLYMETYKAVRNEDGTWGEPVNLNINGPYSIFAAKTSFEGSELYYATSDLPGNLGESDIYFSKKMPDGNWSPPETLGPNINTQYNDDHPCLSTDGHTLYFARNKMGDAYGWEIMVSKKVNGKWAEAEKLGPPINERNWKKSANYQPFITADGKELYFTRIQQTHKSVRQPDGKWGKPVRIFKRVSGHPSVTADGRYLYFISFKDRESQKRNNLTAWFSEKQKDGSWGTPKPVD